jgi:hypothetical protein
MSLDPSNIAELPILLNKKDLNGLNSDAHLIYARNSQLRGIIEMARTAKRRARREWTAQDIRDLKKHSKSRTPVAVISKTTKRTPGALRQKARVLGLPLGHRRYG